MVNHNSGLLRNILHHHRVDGATTTSSDGHAPPTNNIPLRMKLLKAFEAFLGFAPFFAVQVMQTHANIAPAIALGAGALVALFVIFYAAVKDVMKYKGSPTADADVSTIEILKKFRPAVLDLGQFILFAFLVILAAILSQVSKSGSETLVLWFNPITTGGLACIMLFSIIFGVPFTHSNARSQMPPGLWPILSKQQWFLEELEDIAWFWTDIMFVMTIVVTIQPAFVAIFHNDGEKVQDDVATLGKVLNILQFLILFHGMTKTKRMSEKMNRKVYQVLSAHPNDEEAADEEV